MIDLYIFGVTSPFCQAYPSQHIHRICIETRVFFLVELAFIHGSGGGKCVERRAHCKIMIDENAKNITR